MFSQINVRIKSIARGAYTLNHVIKFIKMTLNSKHRAGRNLRKRKRQFSERADIKY